ncbi:aspartic peptidase domain-containing protein [Cantharellus anzutake]|uniref:aspartic peptidase domain-containing protein n=1 Tax=Cantharellus anzutake TaxID=1750568 RepID=UPI001906493B|nr:aspartic peptidase domain-containing protein [Cantharellus anzutake]XP_038918162.1 aspartic peptidase domain-containing protein [Cantharellus anzutake]KAF8318941.1 aspartic peptidase domain-containing protein [Cantharellus anzutake]KAF8334656.1 aspartic peptidase domain-containing protein [Cantharellus anzutake]
MSTGLSLTLKKNPAWKPHGPKDYARSARKWGIQSTEQTAFYVHENTLLRRTAVPTSTEQDGAPSEARSAKRRSIFASIFRGSKDKKSAAGTAKVPTEDVQNDLEYVVPVTIGTPGVTVNLDFDTGSADLWVWSSLLRVSKAVLKNHQVYNPAKSSTAQAQKGLLWTIHYGDNSSASGTVYTDTVKLDTLSVPNQAVELASKLSPSFLNENASDGLLGLAFPSINTVSPTSQKTPVQNMIEQGLISQPIFTAKLDKGDSSGFYTFGYIDQAVAGDVSSIQYTAVDSSNGFWEFPSETLKVGNKIVQRASGNTAIADTGTTLILLDDAACSAIYGSVSGATLNHSLGGWALPTDATLPATISFAVGSLQYSIPGGDLIFADAGNGFSFGSIQSRGQNPQDILGDVFLKRVYAIFDQTPDAPKIGFVQRTDW